MNIKGDVNKENQMQKAEKEGNMNIKVTLNASVVCIWKPG